jgi:hypothetical protein
VTTTVTTPKAKRPESTPTREDAMAYCDKVKREIRYRSKARTDLASG